MISGFEMIDEHGQVLAKGQTGADLVKAHVEGYYRKDGTYVKPHDNGRPEAAPKAMSSDAVKQHAVAAGAKFKSNVAVFTSAANAHMHADKTSRGKGGRLCHDAPRPRASRGRQRRGCAAHGARRLHLRQALSGLRPSPRRSDRRPGPARAARSIAPAGRPGSPCP